MKIELILRHGITALFLTLFAASSAVMQTPGTVTPSAPKQTLCGTDYSIEFVKFGERESDYGYEGVERIWLRFKNTSKKTLRFSAKSDQRTLDFLMRKNDELGIYYDVVNKNGCDSEEAGIDELPIGYTRREVYYVITLKPRETFDFSVARKFLSPGRAVYITYHCSRKCKAIEKDESKKAYFFSSDLPKALIPKK